MKNFIEFIKTLFQFITKNLDMITLNSIVGLLKLDKLYLFLSEISILDLIKISIVLSIIYGSYKSIYFIFYVFQPL